MSVADKPSDDAPWDSPSPVSAFSSAHRYFESHPWTAPLLSDPSLCLHHPSSRHPKRSTEDSLFSTTFSSPSTVPHCIAYHPLPAKTDEHVDAATTLFALGNDLNGFPKILHGGVVATLIDEAMGVLLNLDADRKHLAQVALGRKDGEWSERPEHMTSRLDTRFLKPVQTPGVVAVRVKVSSREGRRVELLAEVVQWRNRQSRGDGHGWSYGQGDGEELVCATGRAEFLEPRKSRL